MAGDYWADHEEAELEEPVADDLQYGIREGRPIPGRWINWVLNTLHAAFVTGIYFIYRIRVGTVDGFQEKTEVYTNNGVTKLLEIDEYELDMEIPIDAKGIEVNKPVSPSYDKGRLYMSDGPEIGRDISGASNFTWGVRAVSTGVATPTFSSNRVWYKFSAVAEYVGSHAIVVPVNGTDYNDYAGGLPLYAIKTVQVEIELTTGYAGDTYTLEVGYLTSNGTWVSLATKSKDYTDLSGGAATITITDADIGAHTYEWRTRQYEIRMWVELATDATPQFSFKRAVYVLREYVIR